jgi:hypothetical protein
VNSRPSYFFGAKFVSRKIVRPKFLFARPATFGKLIPNEPMTCGEKKSMTAEARIAEAADFAKPICNALRAAIRRAAPKLREMIKWGQPCYEGRSLVCGFAPFKRHVNLFFFKRARVPDPEGVLVQGEDNASVRSVKFRSLEEVPVKKMNGSSAPPKKLAVELYDLKTDPAQTGDVASAHPDIVARMEKLMREQHTPSGLFPFPELDRAAKMR